MEFIQINTMIRKVKQVVNALLCTSFHFTTLHVYIPITFDMFSYLNIVSDGITFWVSWDTEIGDRGVGIISVSYCVGRRRTQFQSCLGMPVLFLLAMLREKASMF